MKDTLSEGTARATQLAPAAVTAGALGGDLCTEVWLGESLRRPAARRGARAIARFTQMRVRARVSMWKLPKS